MYRSIAVVISFVWICTAVAANHIQLTDINFETEIKNKEPILIMFFDPNCSNCKLLHPEFDKLPAVLPEMELKVRLAKLDCTDDGEETCDNLKIGEYPTLKLFRNGKEIGNYDNKFAKTEDLVEYLREKLKVSSEITNQDDLDEFIKKQTGICIVGFFDKNSISKQTFENVAIEFKSTVVFGHCITKEIKNEEYLGNIVLFRPEYLKNIFDEPYLMFDLAENEENILAWVSKNMHGLVGHRKLNNKQDFQKPLIVAYYNIDYIKNVKGTNYWRNRILKVAKHCNDNFTFAISSLNEFSKELKNYGIIEEIKPKPIVIAFDENDKKFVMEQNLTVEALDNFVHDFAEGKLPPFLKSEPIPENNNNALKIAVADNFDALVMKNKNDVLIKFYAPWCSHCTKLAPIYNDVAEALADEDVEVVKFDVTVNDIPSMFNLKGYPALYWIPKDAKDAPIEYDDRNDYRSLLQFVAKHATTELKGFNRDGKSKVEKEL